MEAQEEIDEFTLQLSLGKAEAKEKFEEVKRAFRKKVVEFKELIDSQPVKSISKSLKQKVETLELQLALGKAETREEFSEQKQKIQHLISEMENDVASWFQEIDVPSSISHEIEKFKLKLEVLKLKFDLKKFELKDDFKDSMSTAKREIEKISSRVKSKMNEGKRKYSDFSEEIGEAYGHIKSAVKKL